MFRFLNILFLFLIGTNVLNSQSVANIRAGALIVGNDNDDLSFRPGYNVGIQARIGAPGFFMSPGVYFQKFTISEYNKKEYLNDRPSYTLVKVINNFGFENKIVKWLHYRIYAGVNLNYILSISNNDRNIDFNSIYDGFFGYNYGAGVTLGFLTLDFKYEKSFTEFYRDINKSKINFSTISLGFVF